MLEPVGWVARRKRRGAAGEFEVRQMGEAKEIEVPTLARRSLPGKGMVQVGTTSILRGEYIYTESSRVQASSLAGAELLGRTGRQREGLK